MKKAYLILDNGTILEGEALGAVGTVVGDIVIDTGVVGYTEALTAPQYKGKLLLQTFPSVGNYGVIPEDIEGETTVSGYIVRECSDTPSNFRSQGALADYLAAQHVIGIQGIDTRALTRLVRSAGNMKATITDTLPCRTLEKEVN